SNTVFLQRGTTFTGVNVWNTDSSGDWGTASNWSAGLPVAGQTVIIDRGIANPIISVTTGTQFTGVLQSTEAITVSGGTLSVSDNSTTSGTFTLSGGTLSGSGTLTLTGASNTWSSGTMNGAGSTVVTGGLTINGTGLKDITQRTVVNNGTAT